MQNNEDIIIDQATDSADSAVHTHTLPDGTTVSIRRGSAESIVSFLKLYSGEGSPCSD